jgi:hypothetical protein
MIMADRAAVDLAMVLAVDGSASVTYDEFGLIAGGMAAALRDPAVIAGLTGGPAHGSLLCLLLWSGAGQHEVITDWTHVTTEAEVRGFADSVDNMPRVVPAGQTAIGEALLASLSLLAHAPGSLLAHAPGSLLAHALGSLLAHTPGAVTRSIVNVIGDGRSNDGIAPGPIRDRMAQANITINGLCILHEEPDLLQSYTEEVIGGPGAFAVTCAAYVDFTEAMRQKLTRELKAPIA